MIVFSYELPLIITVRQIGVHVNFICFPVKKTEWNQENMRRNTLPSSKDTVDKDRR